MQTFGYFWIGRLYTEGRRKGWVGKKIQGIRIGENGTFPCMMIGYVPFDFKWDMEGYIPFNCKWDMERSLTVLFHGGLLCFNLCGKKIKKKKKNRGTGTQSPADVSFQYE